MTTTIQEIPLSQLMPSPHNVRRTAPKTGVDELAASIAAHGLLQNLTVRAAENGKTKRFEVIAGGRRLAALKLLAKRKLVAKNAPVPCHVIEEACAEEISLAENALQAPMHPADQFEAFAQLHGEHGMNAEDIAARFGVTATVVRQRLRLGAVSPALMQIYRDGGMNLEQLTAFAICDDHARQEQVWQELPSFDRDRAAILDKLNEDSVSVTDRRAIFIGTDAYAQAGGTIIRDLFDEEEGGFLADAELVDRLVREKLQAVSDSVSAEGWKWVTVMPAFDYEATAGMRRVSPEPRILSDDEEARLAELQSELDRLDSEDSSEEERERIEQEIATLWGEDEYAAEDVARAGAFVCLGYDGEPRIERGFVRAEDQPQREGEAPATARGAGPATLPDKLVAELTSYRTAALRNELGQKPELALAALTHALTASAFFSYGDEPSCLRITLRRRPLAPLAPEIEACRGEQELAQRHAAWAQRMPDDAEGLWEFVESLDPAEQLALLAHCAALSLDAVRSRDASPALAHADQLASRLSLDMKAYWEPTPERYFGRVSKDVILAAIREGVSPDAAANMAKMKKQALAEAAAARVAGTGWLPELLR